MGARLQQGPRAWVVPQNTEVEGTRAQDLTGGLKSHLYPLVAVWNQACYSPANDLTWKQLVWCQTWLLAFPPPSSAFFSSPIPPPPWLQHTASAVSVIIINKWRLPQGTMVIKEPAGEVEQQRGYHKNKNPERIFPQCTHPLVSPETDPASGTRASVGIKRVSYRGTREGRERHLKGH